MQRYRIWRHSTGRRYAARRRSIFITANIAAICLLGGGARAASTLMRYPTGSATTVAFVAHSDLWTVPRDGGRARRLVRSDGYVLAPRLSPDGRWIAYTERAHGGQDVFVVAVDGGAPRRLTHDAPPGAGDNLVVGWTPDAAQVIFLSTRMSVAAKQVQAYEVPVVGGLATRLPLDSAGRLDVAPDGRIALTRTFTDLATRKRYLGGMAEDVFVYDPSTRRLDRITDWKGTDGSPMWAGRRIYYVSDRGEGFRLNIWRHDLDGGADRQITHFRDFDVDWPSSGGGRILFQQGGRLWALELADERLHPLRIDVPDDGARTAPRTIAAGAQARQTDVSGAPDYAVMPDGVAVVLAAHGDLFRIETAGGAATDVTQTPDRDDEHPAISPDGRTLAYVTEDDASQQIAVRPLSGGEPRQVTHFDDSVLYAPTFSADGRRLVVGDAQHRLWLIATDGSSTTLLAHDPLAEIRDAAFSPDGTLVAFSTMRPTGLPALHLYRIADRRAVLLSGALDGDRLPAFSADGRALVFASQRSENVVTGDRGDEASIAAIASDGLYSAPVADGADMMRRATPLGGKTGRITAVERRGGSILYETRPPARIGGDLSGAAELHRIDPDGRNDTLLRGFDSQVTAEDGRHLLFHSSGGWLTRAVDGVERPLDLAGLSMIVRPRQEWREMVDHAWRLDRDLFFSRVMNGSDWLAVRRAYTKLLPLVGSRDDAQWLIGQIQGEIATSHAYLGGLDADPSDLRPRTPRLGVDLAFDPAIGHYRIPRILEGDPTRPRFRAPLNDPGKGPTLSTGTILLAIDDVPLTNAVDPDEPLVGKSGPVELTVEDQPGGPVWTVQVRPLASELDVRQHDWIEANRARVGEMSGGRVGYVFLGDFAGAGAEDLQRQLQGQLDKEGLVFDLRWNRGGYTSQAVLNVLMRTRAGGFVNRDDAFIPLPLVTAPRAMTVLVNPQTASDGDQFAYFFRANGLGAVVGERTWGGVQGIRGPWPLMDGTTITIPKDSLATTDGRWIIENAGVDPDVQVDPMPDEVVTGRDRMLEKAVATTLARIGEHPPPPSRVPAPLPAYPPQGEVPGASFGTR